MNPKDILSNPAHGVVKETRPLQIALAEYLDRAFNTDTPCMVEAGTGIGKSFAYLLNAIALAKTGKKIVVSTAMKSLQQQIYFKDLPYLQTKGYHVPYARVLGKSNYGCKRQVYLNVFNKVERKTYDEFFDTVNHWVWEDAPQELAEALPFNKHDFSVAYCSKENCDHYDQCSEKGYVAAQDEIKAAKILVVNHAVVGADMKVFAQHDKKMLGDFTTLIVDEAHKYPEAIRNALACEMPAKFFEKSEDKYNDLYMKMVGDIGAMMHDHDMEIIPEVLPVLHQLQTSYRAMFLETQRTGTYGASAQAFARTARGAILAISKACDIGSREGRDFLHGGLGTAKLHPNLRKSEAAMQILYYLSEYTTKLEQFANAIDLASVETLRYVVTVEEDQRKNMVIKTLPIQIDERLVRFYADRNIIPNYLSATLTVNDKFDYFAREVGHDAWTTLPPFVDADGDACPRPPPTFHAGTPFDYAKQAWCYVPQLPEPNQETYMAAVIDECFDLLMANEGHAFILFTSYKDLEAVGEGLRAKGYPYPLLMQGPTLKARGREIFLNTPNATLLGTRTFWEGIDVPGLHLSLVIIPKAPFPNPTDAVVKAKSAIAGDRWFNAVYMPMMLTDLRQMAGRLIRSMDDKGIVALLDGRVHTKNYGKQMVDAVSFPWGSSKTTATKLLSQLSRKRNAQKDVA
jgi:ATP-dependent DNA helicase DinG